jgi:hypothetical protein
MKLLARPIDAVVVFVDRERPRPFKFKYVDEDGGERVVKIDRVISVSEQVLPGARSLIFECQSNRGGDAYRYQLRYSLDSCRWLLYKM